MLEDGADIRYVQEQLGHRLVTSTEIYTRVSINKLREVYERNLPPEFKNLGFKNRGFRRQGLQRLGLEDEALQRSPGQNSRRVQRLASIPGLC